jgi:hypothetical protein
MIYSRKYKSDSIALKRWKKIHGGFRYWFFNFSYLDFPSHRIYSRGWKIKSKRYLCSISPPQVEDILPSVGYYRKWKGWGRDSDWWISEKLEYKGYTRKQAKSEINEQLREHRRFN